MKLHLTQSAGQKIITGYSESWVEVNQSRHSKSLIVLSDRVITEWDVAEFGELTAAHFEKIALLAPEIVLLGTGTTQQFVHPKLSRALTERGISVECMSTAAACRTYNFLVAEARHVIAALIIQATKKG